jgi:hypothetical protein
MPNLRSLRIVSRVDKTLFLHDKLAKMGKDSHLNRLNVQVPILPDTIFPILHIFVGFFTDMCKISYKFVKNESYQFFKKYL